jgi:hypothetical protein
VICYSPRWTGVGPLIFGVWTHLQAMDLPSAQRHYSYEEKSQLIANLNIEGPLFVPLNFQT